MPKKGEDNTDEEGPLLLGRFGTSLKIGIVGLPNVGYVRSHTLVIFDHKAAQNTHS